MAEDEISFKGASPEELMAIACKAVAFLCDKDPELVKPTEDGEVLCAGDSSGIVVSAESDPPALTFKTYLLEGIDESPALYALINEINADIAIGQLYYHEKDREIRYFYSYPTQNPSVEAVAYIMNQMLENADLYDDRLKTRLGGQRFIEADEDEIEV